MKIAHQFQERRIILPLEKIIVTSTLGAHEVGFREKYWPGDERKVKINGEVDEITAMINPGSNETTVVVIAKTEKRTRHYYFTPNGEKTSYQGRLQRYHVHQ